MFKQYALDTAIGLLLGFVLVWWVRPDSSAGAVILVLATALICFVAMIVLRSLRS